MNDSFLTQANRAFDSGHAQQGLELLRQYNRTNVTDAASWHRQANIEEQIGRFSAAGEAHFQCIQAAPNNAIGYLYAGYWLKKKEQNIDAAAALYSIAYDLDPSILTLWAKSNVSPPTQGRSREANKILRHFLSEKQRKTCASLKNAKRIENAHWVQTSDQAVLYGIDNFEPALFFIPGLPTKPFYDAKDFAWSAHLSRHTHAIQQELTNAMDQRLTKEHLRPYLSDDFSNHSNLSELANSTNWMAIDLFKSGELNTDASTLFPNTLEALKALPTYNLNDHPFEVFFSFLKPQQAIAPHFGQSNHALTVHLPLEIPMDCHLKVDTQTQTWKEGEPLIFDDSYLHSAHNNSDQTRVVLIFSIWHPNLTDTEKYAIQRSFTVRQHWLSNRSLQLQKLL